MHMKREYMTKKVTKTYSIIISLQFQMRKVYIMCRFADLQCTDVLDSE